MIEVWLQITCDNEDCDETDNSTWPNQSKTDFRAERRRAGWVYTRGKDYCSKECRDARKP